jgi:hypothetical protein
MLDSALLAEYEYVLNSSTSGNGSVWALVNAVMKLSIP